MAIKTFEVRDLEKAGALIAAEIDRAGYSTESEMHEALEYADLVLGRVWDEIEKLPWANKRKSPLLAYESLAALFGKIRQP